MKNSKETEQKVLENYNKMRIDIMKEYMERMKRNKQENTILYKLVINQINDKII